MHEHYYGKTLLAVENVSLSFGDSLVLRDVNINVKDVIRPGMEQGQVIAFLGPSGRGKTQLSKILAGLKPATSGRVLVNDPPTEVKAGMVGYVTQNYFLRPNRTVIGNLVVAATQAGMTRKVAKEKAEEYLNLFELGKFAKYYPNQLSGGQRQRVAIAQQLLCSDHYLIMDEPFSGLDPIMKEKVCELLVEISRKDSLSTMIIVSQDIRPVLKVADTVWLLGQDKDQNGDLIPGSYIKKTYDLVEEDLCWDPAIFTTDRFNRFVMDVEAEFRNL